MPSGSVFSSLGHAAFPPNILSSGDGTGGFDPREWSGGAMLAAALVAAALAQPKLGDVRPRLPLARAGDLGEAAAFLAFSSLLVD